MSKQASKASGGLLHASFGPLELAEVLSSANRFSEPPNFPPPSATHYASQGMWSCARLLDETLQSRVDRLCRTDQHVVKPNGHLLGQRLVY